MIIQRTSLIGILNIFILKVEETKPAFIPFYFL